ncbi:MAG TPA: RDD family protein [Rhodocyclaceae bacterium]|nr:RDD family protein [Rhodocyclaceae bacterium]
MTQELNPYRPPMSDVADVEPGQASVVASKGRRFGTLLIDYACYMATSFGVGLFVAVVFGDPGIEAIQAIPDLVFGLLIISFYYIFFEGIWARTPGKFVCGTVVINEGGGRPSLGQIAGRTFCRFIPFEALSFFGERGWHDSISKTRVVLAQKT